MNKVTLLKGDCLQKLKELKDNSVDSVVTDPPYGIGFMGKAWDTFDTKNVKKANEDASKSFDKTKEKKQANPNLKGRKNAPIGGKATFAGTYDLTPSGTLAYQQFCEEWGRECLRVLKPGGHLLSSCSPRMYHRMTVGLEDAGFEIRDQIMWIYGSGFPKSHNIGKAVDKIEGNQRVVVGIDEDFIKRNPNNTGVNRLVTDASGVNKDNRKKQAVKNENAGVITKGNSDWEGWGTALKPAHEPIVMARKPFKGNVAQNVLEWGTGGINVDGCRIGNEVRTTPIHSTDVKEDNTLFGLHPTIQHERVATTEGRFPANIIFDEEAGKILDEQSGVSKSSGGTRKKDNTTYDATSYNKVNPQGQNSNPYSGEVGGASRFFYCPKSSKKDRNEGMPEQVPQFTGRPRREDGSVIYKETHPEEWAEVMKTKPRKEKTSLAASEEILQPTTKGTMNTHPTVKPTDLMAYLIRLITPKGGLVLDPFMGSGSTGKAAVREGMNFIGIEREDEYMEIAKSRIEHEQKKNKHQDFFDI